MTIKKIPIWMDCDPGQDDTVAIIIACFHPNFELLGISTTHGNVSLKHTTENAMRVLTAIGRTDVPVFPGAKHAIDHIPEVYAPEIHGKTGLNGSNLLPRSRMTPQAGSALHQHLAGLINKYANEICIVATGPLTNLCLFFREHPDMKAKVKWLSVMGGGFCQFNKNGKAEFNFLCDPRAANEIVSDTCLQDKIILASLDITSKVFFASNTQLRVLDHHSIETASNFRALLFQLIDSYDKRMIALGDPTYKGPVIHDPVALVALLHFEHLPNDLDFHFDKRYFRVGIAGSLNGAIHDIELMEEGSHGINVLTDLNVEKFWDLVLSVYEITDKHAWINKLERKQLIEENE